MGLRNKQNSLAVKVGMGFGIVGVVFVVALLMSIYEIYKIDHTTKTQSSLQSPIINHLISLDSNLARTLWLQKESLTTDSQLYQRQLEQIWNTEIKEQVAEIKANLDTIGNTRLRQQFDRIEGTLSAMKGLESEIQRYFAENNKEAALQLINEELLPLNREFKSNLANFSIIYQNLFVGGILETKQGVSNLLIYNWSFLILTIFMCVILGLILTKSLTKPVNELVGIANNLAKGNLKQKINITGASEFETLSASLNSMVKTLQNLAEVTGRMATGDYSKRVEVKSKDDTLAITVNQMLDNFNQIVQQANAIAKGDYSNDIQARSKHDVLGNSLQNMTKMLRENKRRNEEETWLKDGLAHMANKISGFHKITELCDTAINTVSRYTDAAMGVIYLYDEEEEILKLIASYAYTHRGALSNQFKLGQGIIGQVGIERKAILLESSEEHLIQSGTQTRSPTNVYAFPLLKEDTLIGVVELSMLAPLSKLQVDYLEQLSTLLASQILSAQQRSLTEKLLQESKKSAEKLQTQQEELKATNEELEQQTQILKASEEEIRLKEEQTQSINKQLEERTADLEKQKAEIEQKNTALHRASDALQQKAQELERASAYKSEFLANMSHELRTPLNSLLILARIFADNEEGNLDEEQVESAEIMYKSGHDLLELINDILDLAKVEAGKIELNCAVSPLQKFIDNVNRDFTHVTDEKGIDLVTELDNSLPENIITDDHRVYQIIRNLMSNAIKFTSQGEVTFSIQRCKDEKLLHKYNLPLNSTIVLSVSDTGIGIPEEKQKLIFNSFQQADGTTSREYGGTGLGLSISTQLASLLGGVINVESTEGRGSTFSLYLPEEAKITKTNEEEESEEEYQAELVTPTVQQKFPETRSLDDDRNSISESDHALLIVEDDLKFAKVLMGICRKRGFKCLHTVNAESALELVQDYRLDGILLDLGLPGMDGLTLLDKLKGNEATRFVPVHVISASDKSKIALKKGAVGYLTKPVTQEQLESAIKIIEEAQEQNISDVLLIDAGTEIPERIEKLITNKDINVTTATTGQQALEITKDKSFDCIILSLELPDISGEELLEKFSMEEGKHTPAIIIHTDKMLTQEETEILNQYADSIIIKGGDESLDRLLDETKLFLHRVANKHETENHSVKIPRQPAKSEGNATLEGKKILVVDDDMRNTFALSKVLKSRGINVIMAANGKTALDTIDQQPDIDMVLMDIMMPVMDGYEAISKIRKDKKLTDLPIIALTAKAMAGDKEKCFAAGASDFVAKPIEPDSLLTKIQHWLAR